LCRSSGMIYYFFFQAEDCIRDDLVTGVQTCALPIFVGYIGDGTFTDVTDKAGVAASGWSTSAAFFDYNRDGYLDLFVGRYLDWRSEERRVGKSVYLGGGRSSDKKSEEEQCERGVRDT